MNARTASSVLLAAAMSSNTMESRFAYVGDILLMKTYTPEVGAKRRKNRRESEQYKMTDGHPSIITREAFAAVQEEKKRRSNLEIVENTPKRTGKRYMSKFSLQDYLNEISE